MRTAFKTTRRTYPKNWMDVRQQVINRDNSCSICGETENLQVHHIIPLARGGTNIGMNLVTLCTGCHGKKHGKKF